MDLGAGQDPFLLPRQAIVSINRVMGGFDECCANIFERHAIMQALQAHHDCLGKVLTVIGSTIAVEAFRGRA
ncbi:hypothetical protein ACVJBD_004927 [Rhizobium mongolense]